MIFDGWFGLPRVVVAGTAAHAALVPLLRVSGKRTLAKLNAFDLVVTVAPGSTLATVLLSESVALAKGATPRRRTPRRPRPARLGADALAPARPAAPAPRRPRPVRAGARPTPRPPA
jgi:hypothetical protein